MYKLYYSPGACSLAVHMVLKELELPFILHLVSLKKGDQVSIEYKKINPKSRIPALEIASVGILTEVPAILTFLANKHSEKKLLPQDEFLRAKCLEWLVWLSIELHAVGFAKLWRPERFTLDRAVQEKVSQDAHRSIVGCFETIENKLNESVWILGADLSIVDFYLLVFFRWGNRIGYKMDQIYPAWAKKVRKMAEKPSVISALEVEEISIW